MPQIIQQISNTSNSGYAIALRALWTAHLFCIIFLTGCYGSTVQSICDSPCIAIIGDGVPNSTDTNLLPSPVREGVLNLNQGKAMYIGAKFAFEQLRAEIPKGINITLFTRDDGGSPDVAEEIARKLQRESNVLAIIGHGNSTTTKKAAPYYIEAGIPLIMPIATSPDVLSSFARPKEYQYVFRLPPSDRIQAKAIAEFLGKQAQIKTYYLIRDAAPDAFVYSKFLNEEIEGLIGNGVINKYALDASESSLCGLEKNLEIYEPDAIVFSGYGRHVPGVIHAINNAYENARKARKDELRKAPIFLLTDGCKLPPLTLGLQKAAFPVYLTFPVVYDEKAIELKISKDRIKEIIPSANDYTYQLYGYDAMVIILESIIKSKGGVSRRRIKERFKDATFERCIFKYQFRDGEPVVFEYPVFLYDTAKKDFVLKDKIQSVSTHVSGR